MALDPVVNFFRSTIATLPVASGGTVIVLQTGDGNKLPNPAVDGAFNLTIYNADDPFVAPEIVRVTGKSGDTLTVTRAQEGTSATNKTSGSTWNVELTPTAKTIQDIDSTKLDVAGGTMTGDLTIPDKIIHAGDTNTAIRFPANDTVSVETAGSERVRIDSSGNVGIGTTTPATKLDVVGAIRASTGILFGTDTAAANTLDDYEEGTWTPALTSTGATFTYSAINGYYTKIGRLVKASFRINVNGLSGTTSNSVVISGLPFACLNVSTYRGAGYFSFLGATATDMPYIKLIVNPNATLSNLIINATNGATLEAKASDIGSTGLLAGEISYYTS